MCTSVAVELYNLDKTLVGIKTALQLQVPDKGWAVKKILTPRRKTYQHVVQNGKTTLSGQSLDRFVSSLFTCHVGPWQSGLQNSTMKRRSSDQSVEGSLWPQDSE
jgi:hypothetical protein